MLKQDEKQDVYKNHKNQKQKITPPKVADYKKELEPMLEERLVSLRWLTMTLNILKLKKYVKAHRIMKKEPSPSKLNSACTNILNLRKELTSYHHESDEYEPGVITMKRAIRNLKIAIAQHDWVAKEYELEDLYSTICHLDFLETLQGNKRPERPICSEEKEKPYKPNS